MWYILVTYKSLREAIMSNTVKLKQPIKNFMIIGDSYSTFKGYNPEGYAAYYPNHEGCLVKDHRDTWWYRFTQKTSANLVLNDSWSGATVCYTGRISPEYGYRSSFVNRFHLMRDNGFFKKEKIDTVFLFGATNDSWLSTTPKGEEMLSGWREEDLYYALPAISYLIFNLKKELPDANIIYVINTGLSENIVNAIKNASNEFGISYIELENIDKVAKHPTPLGMEQICDQIYNAITE